MITDISTTEDVSFSSDPQGYVELNSVGYVVAHAGRNDERLWRTNGTTARIWLVRGGLSGDYLVAQDSVLFFAGDDGVSGRELWKSDGTEDGTTLVEELAPTGEWGEPSMLMEHCGTLFVDAPTGEDRHEIRRIYSDDSRRPSMDAPSFLDPVQRLVVLATLLIFDGNTAETGTELWSMPIMLPAIASNGVVDAARFVPTMAPGGLATSFGVELAGGTHVAGAFPIPTSLGSVRVQVNGIDAPLLFVPPTQINFQVPFETPTGTPASVVARLGEQENLSPPTAVAEFAPAIFVNPSSGAPIVQRHPNGPLITAVNAAQPGDVLTVDVTGIGSLDNPPASGEAGFDSPLATTTTLPAVTIGGVEADVLFAGLAPGFAGQGQIIIQLPDELPQGQSLELVIRFGDNASQTLQLEF